MARIQNKSDGDKTETLLTKYVNKKSVYTKR